MAIAIGLCAGHRAVADDGEANRLFVEAVKDVRDGDRLAEERTKDRAALYQQALRNFERIIAEHPESDIAVKLIAGEAIGDITQSGVARRAALAGAMDCLERVDALCVLRHAEEAARAAGNDANLDWFHQLRASVYASHGRHDDARLAVKNIEEGAARAWGHAFISGLLAKAGEKEQAILSLVDADRALSTATDAGARVEALTELGVAHLKLGDRDTAEDRWRQAEEVWAALRDPQDRVYRRFASADIKIGGGAIDDAMSDIAWLDREDGEAIEGLDASKFPKAAKEWLKHKDTLLRSYHSAYAKTYSAILYAAAEQPDQAVQSLAAAERNIEKLPRRFADDWLTALLAWGYAATGRFPVALQIAASIEDGYERSLAYAWMTEDGDIDEDRSDRLASLRLSLSSASEVQGVGEMAELIALVAAQMP